MSTEQQQEKRVAQEILAELRRQALADPARLKGCYASLFLARAVDKKMEKLVKQNKGGTFQLSAAGHELIGAVAALHLRPGVDWACCYYRDQPTVLALGADLKELFGVFMGREAAHHSKGRMMPYHFSHRELRMPVQSSSVGTQFLTAAGVALGVKREGRKEVVYVSGGDGATSQGDFYEAMNIASIQQLPLIFCIHDNGWAISVSREEQTAGGSIHKVFGNFPGIASTEVDGTDFCALDAAFRTAVHRGREGEGPSLIVAQVPRLEAHSNSDDPKKYRTPAALEGEKKQDPLPRFRSELIDQWGLSAEELSQIEKEIHLQVERAAQEADSLPFPSPATATDHLFAPVEEPVEGALNQEGERMVMIDAIHAALEEEMERDPKVLVFGEDVAHGKGGVFGATRGLTERYGKERCFNTPLAEALIIGLGCGLAMEGSYRPVVEIQFADYLWPGFDQLLSEVATSCYRSGGEFPIPLVVRMPSGGYIQGGPSHSQSIEGFLTHCPGVIVVCPSNAADAKGLLKWAIRNPNPVLFLEPKALYRQAKFSASVVGGKEELIPFGKAKCVLEGRDLTFVGWGMMIPMAVECAARLAKEGISIEILDLRTLAPWDRESVIASVQKTGKLLVAHEAPRFSGFGAEVAAEIAEEAFEYLDAPPMRIGGKNAPIPYSQPLENVILPQTDELEAALRKLYQF